MCLIPGMLSPAPSRPSSHALRLAFVARVVIYALSLLAAARILSFSVWASLSDLFVAIYGYFVVIHPFAQPEPAIYIENILCYAIFTGFNAILSIFTLMDIATGKQTSFEKLAPWQVIAGLIVSGIGIAIYLLLTGLVVLLYNNLKTTLMPVDEESMPFMRDSYENRSGYFSGSRSQGQPFPPPAGQYSATDPHSTSKSGTTKSDQERFPGKGYKLSD